LQAGINNKNTLNRAPSNALRVLDTHAHSSLSGRKGEKGAPAAEPTTFFADFDDEKARKRHGGKQKEGKGTHLAGVRDVPVAAH